MGQHLSPRYGQVILVSGYPVLTAVNWTQHWCAICVQYQSSCALRLARKREIEHWFSSGADGRAGTHFLREKPWGRGWRAGGVVSRDYQIFWDGWIYLPMVLRRRASRARAPLPIFFTAVSREELDSVGNTRRLLMPKCSLFQWFFFLWRVDYALEGNILTEQMWFLPLISYWEVVTQILIFCSYCLWSEWFALWCKSTFFDLFWKVKLFNAAK